jgi:hypothetical protein
VRKVGPSRALMVVAAVSLAAVVVLSVLLARRHSTTQIQLTNPTQFALNGAVQAAEEVYSTNQHSFPRGDPLLNQLHKQDPELLFAFGPQSVAVSLFSSGPLPPTGVSVAVSEDGQVVMFGAQATSGACWYATENRETDSSDGGLDGASVTAGVSYAVAANQQTCVAGVGLPTDATTWHSTWPSG